MHHTLDDHTLADLLPGTWAVEATNFPMWLTGQRRAPRFSYELVSREPLIFADDVAYVDSEGRDKHILGRDVWHHDEFVWRGRGILRLFTSHWSVAGASDDGTVAVIRFSKSLATPAGVDVVVREGIEHPELRAMVARSTQQLGLSPEEFGSLSWLANGPTG